MKKGHYYNDLPARIPEDFVYHRACTGLKYDPTFDTRWNASNKFQRGIIFVPQITADNDVSDNASLHLQFLQDHNPAWRETYAPLMVDIASSSGMDFGKVRDYANYIRAHWGALPRKALVRASFAVWDKWLRDYPIASDMFDVVEPLVARWGATAPGALYSFGVPAWWEYAQGLIANDETRTWATHPAGAVTPVTPTPEPTTGENPPQEADNSVTKKYRAHGTIGGIPIDVIIEPI